MELVCRYIEMVNLIYMSRGDILLQRKVCFFISKYYGICFLIFCIFVLVEGGGDHEQSNFRQTDHHLNFLLWFASNHSLYSN